MKAMRLPGCYRLGSERSLPTDVCCLSRKGRKDPKDNSEMTPGSTGQGWEGKGRARLSLPLSEDRTAAPRRESQPEPIPQGVTLWMGPHLAFQASPGDTVVSPQGPGLALQAMGLI